MRSGAKELLLKLLFSSFLNLFLIIRILLLLDTFSSFSKRSESFSCLCRLPDELWASIGRHVPASRNLSVGGERRA